MKFFIRVSIFTLILILSIGNLKSQSLEFVTTPESNVSGNPNDEIKAYAEVRNKSMNTISLKLKMTMISLTEGHMVYFCLGNCFPPRTTDFEMPDNNAITLAPGETTEGAKFFDVVLVPNGIEGPSTVKVIFSVVGNPNDNLEYTVIFNSTTPVFESDDSVFLFGEPMPNPVTDYVNFSYELPVNYGSGYIEIYNVQGNLINSIKLNGYKIEKYNTALLPNGTYYAVMNFNDKKREVRKFVVSH